MTLKSKQNVNKEQLNLVHVRFITCFKIVSLRSTSTWANYTITDYHIHCVISMFLDGVFYDYYLNSLFHLL